MSMKYRAKQNGLGGFRSFLPNVPIVLDDVFYLASRGPSGHWLKQGNQTIWRRRRAPTANERPAIAAASGAGG
jgi:hypothetical protein